MAQLHGKAWYRGGIRKLSGGEKMSPRPRSRPIAVIALCCGLLMLTSQPGRGAEPGLASRRPNIVCILADDMD